MVRRVARSAGAETRGPETTGMLGIALTGSGAEPVMYSDNMQRRVPSNRPPLTHIYENKYD